MMQPEKKWHTCSGCGKNLSSYRSLWRHKNNCRQSSADVHTTSMPRDRSPVLSRASNTRIYNVSSAQPPLTFVVADDDDDKDSSCEKRPTNPKIQALLNEIINDGDNDPKRYVKPPQVIHKGFSIIPPTTTTTTTSRSSKSSRRLAPESEFTLTTRE